MTIEAALSRLFRRKRRRWYVGFPRLWRENDEILIFIWKKLDIGDIILSTTEEKMKRRAFYSFHYANDVMRTAQVRNIGMLAGERIASDNGWEKARKTNPLAIKNWIAKEMRGKSVVIVLIGEKTAQRKWVKHEIKKGWDDGMGVLGIHIHGLKDPNTGFCKKGANPFDGVRVIAKRKQAHWRISASYRNIFNPASLGISSSAHLVCLGTIVHTHDIPFRRLSPLTLGLQSLNSRHENSGSVVYNTIEENLENWIEEAIKIRKKYA